LTPSRLGVFPALFEVSIAEISFNICWIVISEMSTESLFGNNQKFKEAILTINNLDNEKFALLISRIIKKLDVKVLIL
jgi:hypothetical protein